MNIREHIISIIKSANFRKRLERINQNYFNLKQEGMIRNSILERLNHFYVKNGNLNLRAIAEHPRVDRTRVDLSVVNNENKNKPYKIEFKFQFTKDFNKNGDYTYYIDNDYAARKSDMFILIVASWNTGEKNAFDDMWGIEPRNRLSKYIASYEDWEEVYDRPFRDYNILTGNKYISEFDKIEIEIDPPYKTRYLFYILSKKPDINQE